MLRSVILSSLPLYAFTSEATVAGYYGRFWCGQEKTAYPHLRNYCDDCSSDCFVELVNRCLIPARSSDAVQVALMVYSWFRPGQKPGQADHYRLHPGAAGS